MIGIVGKKKRNGLPSEKVGLDIGSRAVKILHISGPADKPVLAGMGGRDIYGMSKQDVTAAIKELAVQAKVTTKEVAIAISGAPVIVRIVSMPKMTHEELKGAVRFEAEKFIPFNINECVLDYSVIQSDGKENKATVLLAVAKKESVMTRIGIVEDAGFTVQMVDIDSIAIANSFIRNFPAQDKEKTFAVLDIGAKYSNLIIVRGGTLYFVRDIVIGGDDFSTAISKTMNIDIKAAEAIKILPGDKLQEIASATRNVVNNLIEEIRLSFGYYENQNGRGIDEIYISGGGADLAGIDVMFQEAFGSKPVSWNPLGFLDTVAFSADTESEKIRKSFAICAGLSLR